MRERREKEGGEEGMKGGREVERKRGRREKWGMTNEK